MADLIPKAAKKKMEKACQKVARKVGKAVESIDDDKKLEKAIIDKCHKEIKTLDKTVVQFFADQLKEALDKKKKKPAGPSPLPKVSARWVPKPPGSGVPSLTIPITEWVVDPKLKTKAKFSIKVWGDPREFEKADKGVMVNFTVVNW
jgi:hypothetical protein